MLRNLPVFFRIFLLVLLGATTSIVDAHADASSQPSNAIGYDVDLADLPSPHPRPEKLPAAEGDVSPIFVRIRVPWKLIEKVRGVNDWTVLDRLVADHADAGFAVILEPHGRNPLYDDPGEIAAAWSAFLGALGDRYKHQVRAYIVGRDIQDAPLREAAFWLKTTSVRIHSVDPDALVATLLDLTRQGALDRLTSLYKEGLAVYVDAIAVRGLGTAGGEDLLAKVKNVMILSDPSATVWWVDAAVPGGLVNAGLLLRSYMTGLAQELDLSLFRLDWDEDGRPALLPVLLRIRETFRPAHSSLTASARGIRAVTPMGEPLPVKTLRLYDPDLKQVLILYDGGEGATRGMQAVLQIDTVDIAKPVLRDVAAGESAPVSAYRRNERTGITGVALPIADYPLVLEYKRFTSPFFGEEEKLEVTEKRLPSVSEIIAAYQAFQAAQDALLINLRADARVDYHFRIGTGAPFDVTLLDKFYLDPKVGAEFEQLEFYVNGVKWRSDRIPEFPLPQPEKVLTLPLQISLDERYRYDLLGEETVDGYDCWVVEFRPLTSDETLYKGRVWIDKKTFARVQLASLETGLDPPIISNEEKDFFRPIRGPDGLEHWVVYKIKGQQLFSTAGRSLVMSREVTFTNHVINDTGFEKLHQRAYASDHQIIRDTPVGHRYLEKTADGGRRVKEELDKDNLFLLGGVFYNRSLDFPVPLAGVNYFNRDLGGRNVQTNIFFAGLLLLANLSEPDLFGTGLDASVDVWAQGFSITDRPVIDSREEESQNVDLTRQNVTVGVGLPFADYWKVKWTGSLEFQGFARDEETKGNFVLPTDTLVTTFGMTGEFNRNAWNVTSRIRVSRRSEWEPWGDPAAPPELNEFDSSRKDFVKYQARVVKDFFLPLNQRVRASVTAFGGADLDRFSKYKFDFFTNRLRGFSGAGYRYTNGATAELQYAFNLANLIRFEATVDQAHVKDRTLPNELGGDYKNFTGLGISGQTILGPNYIISLDWGIALSSGIEDFRGDQEVFITLLRILK